MKGRELKGVAERELDRRQFLKAAGAATVLGAAGVLGGNLLLGCAPTKAPEAGESKVPAGYEGIRIVGSSLGGKGTTAVMVLASILNRYYPEIEWSSSSGSTGTNVVYLTKGSVKLGTTTPGNYIDAYGFDKMPESRLRSINLPSPLSQYIFLIPEDKPWKDITQVPRGLTLSPGSPGTTQPIATEIWLKLCGLSKSDFNWVPLAKGQMGDAWRAGKVDLGLYGISGPEPFLMDMYTSPRKFKAMGLSPEQAAKAKAELTFERAGYESPAMGNLSEIAPELFKYDVVCPQQPSLLSSRDDFPEEIAYKMAKVIDERNQELREIFSPFKYATPQWHIKWARPPLDIHAGVAKYYKEKGYLK